jgi:hypothetical protein
MALFTTTPAKLMTPTPVMIMPNAVPVTRSPKKTPIRESTTDVKMMKGSHGRVELGDQDQKDDADRSKNAFLRNAEDFSCSRCSPVKPVRVASGPLKSLRRCSISIMTSFASLPETLAEMVTTRFWSTLVIAPSPLCYVNLCHAGEWDGLSFGA